MRQFVVALALAACGAEQQPATDDFTVAHVPASPVIAAHDFDLPAVFTSSTSEVLPAPFAARIKKLHVEPGARVKKGDPIATFETAELTSKVTRARAEERANRADAGAAAAEAGKLSKEYGTKQKLRRVGVLSGTEVEAARKDYEVASNRQVAASGRADAASAERTELERQLAQATLTAPFDGIVADVAVHEGEVPAAGARIAQVVEPDHLIVRFALPANLKVAPGQRVEVTSDDLRHSIWATVTRISRERAPINFSVVEAGIADRDRTGLQVASIGHVRIAYAPGVAR